MIENISLKIFEKNFFGCTLEGVKLLNKMRKELFFWIGFLGLLLTGSIIFSHAIVAGENFFLEKKSANNTVTSGRWIPELEVSVEKAFYDEQEDIYFTPLFSPACLKITTDFEDAVIYYAFGNDKDSLDPLNEKVPYEKDVCLEIPSEYLFGGFVYFKAISVRGKNESWKSEMISRTLNVYIPEPL